ncbi:MAG: ABC transporter permease [Dehalococcoidia bacterium]|nr:ABC transporter permease [Dehalococcoidia bacterium]
MHHPRRANERMVNYIVKRLGLAALTLFIVSLLSFSVLRIMPGSAAELMVTDQGYAEDVDRLRDQLGLNDPFHQQLLAWFADIARFDLGDSLYSGDSITSELVRRLPTTMLLGSLILLVGWAVGVPLGILAAVRQGTFLDEASRTVSVLFLAIPSFWLATMFIVFPSIWFGWAPPLRFVSFRSDPAAHLELLLWPALIGGLPVSAGVVRVTRTLMLEVLRQDYMRTARAKGLAPLAVLFRHGLRNAAPVLITILGLQITTVITGTVILEQVFAIPGMGRYILEAAVRRDYPVVQAILLLSATMLLMANLLVDLAYGYLDPRVRVTA